jgi:nucleoside-diphosphate-sugar epimerase
MRILVTGAGGNIGKGLAPRLQALGHSLVLSDVNRIDTGDIPFVQLDIQHGFGLDKAAEGCDMIVHLPAWHGIHWRDKTEMDFWRLNVDGTFNAFQAARATEIKRVVFLSSTAWYGHYDKYGFTKRIGEELCEYNRRNHGVRYVSVRPNNLTPWGDDWLNGYGTRLLYGGVDRDDVLDCITLAVARLDRPQEADPEGIVVEALCANAYSEADIADWEVNPATACARVFPGYEDLVQKYGLRFDRKPHFATSTLGWEEVGYAPFRHFGAFLAELRRLDETVGEAAIRAMRCPY